MENLHEINTVANIIKDSNDLSPSNKRREKTKRALFFYDTKSRRYKISFVQYSTVGGG